MMIDKIKNILSDNSDIDDWKIVEQTISSDELFFVRKSLDMNRAKEVHHFHVTVYKDFEEDGVKYRGSSLVKIHPSMSADEIKSAVDEAVFAAGFVKNRYYPIAEPSDDNPVPLQNNEFSDESQPGLVDSILKADSMENGWINSWELFLSRIHTRIMNSKGVDISFKNNKGSFEFITNWKGNSEEIELYKYLEFAKPDPAFLSNSVVNMLNDARERANAKNTTPSGNMAVLLTGESVVDIFRYYYMQSSARYAYEKTSTIKTGENIQGEKPIGDLISLTLQPSLQDSAESAPFDEDGVSLKPVTIFDRGVLKRYWGDIRYSYYLGVEPTGIIKNMTAGTGSKSIAELKSGPCLEVSIFSDFQMDPVSGDFGGEIRLGWYFDGEKSTPITGGSISGNLNALQKEMYFSKETQKINNFAGPKAIKLMNISVSGQE